MDTLLLIIGNLKFIQIDELSKLQLQADEIKKMLTPLIKSLNNN
jgi:hypothetical protein